jgi:hypothetical protein
MFRAQISRFVMAVGTASLLVSYAQYSLSHPIDYRVVSDSTLTRTRGLDPSSTVKKTGYNCKYSNADAANKDITDPNLLYVPDDNCSIPNGEDYLYENNPCIWCPAVGQSIILNNDSVSNGYVYSDEIPCDGGPPSGQRGTCVDGKCENSSPWECKTSLKFYQKQSKGG